MADNYKLPGSSYEEFVKIIKAYSTGKLGSPMSLETLAQTTGMDKTIVSRNNGFLVQVSLVSEGNKKAPTQEGIDLGRAYSLKIDDQVMSLWRTIIEKDEFLTRMLSAIKIRNGMEKTSFINHILYSSGNGNNNNSRAGASTIIEIYKVAGLVQESDGKIIAIEAEDIPANDIDIPTTEKPILEQPANVFSKTVLTAQNISTPTITINVNINTTTDELDSLSEKLKALIDVLKK